jgi:two-component system sensor histidine kinase/response regulator
MIVLRDITERKQAEEALECYSHKLEAANAELDAFAHTVAHSLRNPLFALTRLAKSLEFGLDHRPVEEMRQDVRAIVQSGVQMGSIIEELLLLASAHKQKRVDIHELDMAAIVNEALERLEDCLSCAAS